MLTMNMVRGTMISGRQYYKVDVTFEIVGKDVNVIKEKFI